jgi:hypothetical protein
MTLNEIIERLEEYRDELGGDCEVRLMTQQNWPFENAIWSPDRRSTNRMTTTMPASRKTRWSTSSKARS